MATHAPIQEGMGTSGCLTKEEATPWYFEQGRRKGPNKTVSTGAHREADLDLHNVQVCSLLPPARAVQQLVTSALLLMAGKHAHGDGDTAPMPQRDPTGKQG